MDTIANSRLTNASISIGTSVNGVIDTKGDHDWYRVQLVAGETYVFTMTGGIGVDLEDPYLYLRDANGGLITENDDAPGRNSQIIFTATRTGTYYLDAGAWDENYTGNFELDARIRGLLSNDEIADQLVNDYWGGTHNAHHFDVTEGGTITINVTALTAAGRNLALTALDMWTDVTGITFSRVTTGGMIIFDDNEEGAFASANYSGGISTMAAVNVSTVWLTNYGTSLYSYSFQTYIHEIGHALGLGHAGNYNGSADYGTDNFYLNDSWASSIMSYFSQAENTDASTQGFSSTYILSPMAADILAMQELYGLSTTTRTGDTVYGFNSTSDRAIHDASVTTRFSYTIVDSGGVDTLDYSEYSQSQLIDLNSEVFMNIGGRMGNVVIARGTVIENTIGGDGNDTLNGNSATNTLNGGFGDDVIYGNDGDDILAGSDGSDTLNGGNGADILNGGAGSDTMAGGPGDDIYYFDNVGDTITELLGEGIDLIRSRIDGAVLSDNVENLILLGATTSGTGNDLANRLAGLSAENIIHGLGGDDQIFGGNGADTLYGDDGNDIINGGSGGDIIEGGAGDDTINGAFGDDVIFGGTGNDSLNGNESADEIHGGDDNDVLRGGEGIDTLFGDAGNDVLRGQTGADILDGGEGNDVLDGGEQNDVLFGGNGNDQIIGGEGKDVLTGGAGADTFQWNTYTEFSGTGLSADQIADFNIADGDRIRLSALDADVNAVGSQEFSFIGNAAFSGAAGELHYRQNGGDTYLEGDTDGDGGANFVIRLDGLIDIPASALIL